MAEAIENLPDILVSLFGNVQQTGTGNVRTWAFDPSPIHFTVDLSGLFLASAKATYGLLRAFGVQPRIAYRASGSPFGRSRRAFKRWRRFVKAEGKA